MRDNVKIVTVLRTSNEYKRDYVEAIFDQCKKFAPLSEFICISDDEKVPGYLKMEHDWPRWWPKIEIFKIKGPVLYLDLDTLIVSDIQNILNDCITYDFIAIRDFYKNPKMQRTLGSGIMFWSGDMRYLYDEFVKDPQGHMNNCNSERWWGDQGFIEKNIKNEVAYWQDAFPNKIVSWKVHCKNGIPTDAAIIAFHGKPKPWEIK
jgi:hypothetical protein